MFLEEIFKLPSVLIVRMTKVSFLLATTGGGSSEAGGARKACVSSPCGAQTPQHRPDHLR